MKNLTPKQLTKAWIKALRSGKFNQTKGALENQEGQCCLGVLCRISMDQFNLKAFKNDEVIDFVLGGSPYGGTLPPKMAKYLRLHGLANPKENSDDFETVLIDMNDEGESFKTIANYIEKNILPLQES